MAIELRYWGDALPYLISGGFSRRSQGLAGQEYESARRSYSRLADLASRASGNLGNLATQSASQPPGRAAKKWFPPLQLRFPQVPDPAAGRMRNLSALSQIQSNRALQSASNQNELRWMIGEAIASGEINQANVWQNIFSQAASFGMSTLETQQLIAMIQGGQ